MLERNLTKLINEKHQNESLKPTIRHQIPIKEHIQLNEEFSRIERSDLNLCTQQAFPALLQPIQRILQMRDLP